MYTVQSLIPQLFQLAIMALDLFSIDLPHLIPAVGCYSSRAFVLGYKYSTTILKFYPKRSYKV